MTSKGARMMRKGILLIGSMAAIAFAAGAAWAAAAPTPTPKVPVPSKGAVLYKTTIVHAMEPCDPGTGVTLHFPGTHGGPGRGELAGCEPVASDALRFEKASLMLKKRSGKIMLNALLGLANAGQQVQVGLTLRSSREKANFWEANDLDVTYLPLELTCPVATAGLNGHVIQTTYLDACTPDGGLAVDPVVPGPPGGTEEKTLDLNIEVLDAVLINVTTGKVFGRAGIAR